MPARENQVLSERALNRALLARQFLLEPAEMPVPRLLERIGGIQAQYAPSMYIGLWSRLASFGRDELTRLLETRQVVQGTLLRSTIHLVSADDYWTFAVAVRQVRRHHFMRTWRDIPDADVYAAAAERLRAALAKEPLRQKALDEVVGRELRSGIGLWLDLVRVPPSGTWERRRADVFAAAADWVPAVEPPVQEAQDTVVRRYLTGFGPATQAEIADWAGLPAKTVAAALERLRLRRFRSENGAELVDLPGLPLPEPATPAPVRFLPTWDATLLVHARRSQILPERHRPKIFSTRMPQSLPTFLVDGQVAGAWRHEQGGIELTEFEPLPPRVRRQVEAEAERLTAFHD